MGLLTARAAAVTIVMSLAEAAYAQTADERPLRLEAGVRLGIALPGGSYESTPPADGSVSTGRSLSDEVRAGVPVSLLLGIRRHTFLAGVRGTYAPVSAARTDCSNLEPCALPISDPGLRAVVEAQYRVATPSALQMWAGAGVGIEWFTARSTRYWGPVLEASLGADHTFPSGWRLGPYLGLSAGQFVHAHRSGSTAYMGSVFAPGPERPPADRDISSRAWHGWIELGIQGAFSR